MKKTAMSLYLTAMFFVPYIAQSRQPFPPPAPSRQQNRKTASSTGNAKIPELRWFKNESGYEEALELQKQTEADLFVLIYNEEDDSEKGLYKWLEKRGLESAKVHNELRGFIKVKINMSKKAYRQLAIREFNTKKTPATFIVWPNNWNKRLNFFDWSGNRPKLLSPEEMVELIEENRSANSEKYQNYKKYKSSSNQQ